MGERKRGRPPGWLKPDACRTVGLSAKERRRGASRQTSVLLAKIAFLLITIAGIWIVFAETLNSQWRWIVAGLLLAVAGLLLIVATHRGQFGSSEDLG